MTCCHHPVTRHAYNGCADCGCNVRWTERPDRESDPDFQRTVENRSRLGIPTADLFVRRGGDRETIGGGL
jgi:hypothetical protein